jgi:hypothetical protein
LDEDHEWTSIVCPKEIIIFIITWKKTP